MTETPPGLVVTPVDPDALRIAPPPEAALEPDPLLVTPARRTRHPSRPPLMLGAVVVVGALVGLVFVNTPRRPPAPGPIVSTPAPPPPSAVMSAPPTPVAEAAPEIVAPPVAPPTTPPRLRLAVAKPATPIQPDPPSAPLIAVPIPAPVAASPPPARELLLRPAIRPPADPDAPVATRAKSPD